MDRFLIAVFVSNLIVFAADATVCKNGKSERKVEVVAKESGKKVPCEVTYTKEGETEGKILWSATNDEGYCEAKAKEFEQKLGTLGWQCEAATASNVEPKAEPAPEKK